MIIATIGVKGGTGKSTIAYHFAVSFFLEKRRAAGTLNSDPVTIYEFDADNQTGLEFVNTCRSNEHPDAKTQGIVEFVHVNRDDSEMLDAASNIDFNNFKNKDVIIDVGGSDNTSVFLDLIGEFHLSSEIVFVIPQNNKKPKGAEDTVEKIRKKIKDPKI